MIFSTNDFKAVIESMFHRLNAINNAWEMKVLYNTGSIVEIVLESNQNYHYVQLVCKEEEVEEALDATLKFEAYRNDELILIGNDMFDHAFIGGIESWLTSITRDFD